jgi:hypothetical protein
MALILNSYLVSMAHATLLAECEDQSKTSKVVVKTLSEEDIPEAIVCLCQAFSDREPMTYRQKITHQEFEEFVSVIAKSTLKSGLSIVVRDKVSNQFVGCMLSQDLMDDAKIELTKVTPKFEPIFAILERGKKIDIGQLQYGKYSHFWLAGIHQEYISKGYFYHIGEQSSLLAARKGYQYTLTECTSLRSLTVARNQGGQDLCVIKYDDFDYKGTFPFKGIKGGVAFMMQDLSRFKTHPRL